MQLFVRKSHFHCVNVFLCYRLFRVEVLLVLCVLWLKDDSFIVLSGSSLIISLPEMDCISK